MKHKDGFTIIEVMIILAIAGLIMVIVFIAVPNLKAIQRDNVRKQHLGQIAAALREYYNNHGNWVESGSGCGYNGSGLYWVSYQASTYPRKIVDCIGLPDLVDPSGTLWYSASGPWKHSYMKVHCGPSQSGATKVYLYARLERLPLINTALDDTCHPTWDSDAFGFNYVLRVN